MNNKKKLLVVKALKKAIYPNEQREYSRGELKRCLINHFHMMSDVLYRFDDLLVGTPHYMGFTYFWDTDYKYYLRETTPEIRIAIHDELLENNLVVSGVSDKHKEIIDKHIEQDKKRIDAKFGD